MRYSEELEEMEHTGVNAPDDDGSSKLDAVVFRCVDETLGGTVGLVAKDTIYLRVLTKFLVSRDDLPAHINDLIVVLEEFFGETPTALITKAIAKRMFAELHLEIPIKENLSLQDYVNEALTLAVNRQVPL